MNSLESAKTALRMHKLNEFKVGDKILIGNPPSSWSSYKGSHSPMGHKYPAKFTINIIEKDNGLRQYIFMQTNGKYGFNLTDLVEKDNIKKM